MTRRPALSLVEQARQAALVRAYQTDPDVVALKVERLRAIVDRLIWSAILLGLAFTMINVQQFAAAGAEPWSLPWLAAWLLDPMVSLVVVAILLAESITSRWQVQTGGWVRTAKWFAVGATYVMNTWQSWGKVFASSFTAGWDQVVLHSVPPLLVLVAAEAAPILRDRLTEAVLKAAHAAQAAAQIAAQHERTAEREDAQRAHDGERDTAAQPAAQTAAQPIAHPVVEPAQGAAPVSALPLAPATEHRGPIVLDAAARTALADELDIGLVDEPAEPGAEPVVASPAPVREPRPLHLVPAAPVRASRPATRATISAPSQQVSPDETTDGARGETDPEARMRAFWDREVRAGRVPTGADLVRAAGGPEVVSPATGRRRRQAWEKELATATSAGGARDAAFA